MKPIKILEILDLAYEIRKNGKIFNPLFIGDSGLGKSQIVQQWVAKKRETKPNFGFIDFRAAYNEAPDIKGFPYQETIDGKQRLCYALPKIFPSSGEGLILLEEVNRSNTMVMNTFMQLLTDRCIEDYKLPDGWIIASCINPDSVDYDVSKMDAALKNRFVFFDIEYDHETFKNHINNNNWHENIVNYITSNMWVYKKPMDIGIGNSYVSPRSWEQMNAVEQAGLGKNQDLHYILSTSILGSAIGREYYSFVFNTSPVTVHDIVKNKKEAFERLKKYSNPGKQYRGDLLSVTIDSIIKVYGDKDCPITEELMVEIAVILPADLSTALIGGCIIKSGDPDYVKVFKKKYPQLESMRNKVKHGKNK